MQSDTVPAGITSINVQGWGAEGSGDEGEGGYVSADLTVTPGVSVTGNMAHGHNTNVWQNTSKVMIMKGNLGSANLEELEQKNIGEEIQVTNSRRKVNVDIVTT